MRYCILCLFIVVVNIVYSSADTMGEIVKLYKIDHALSFVSSPSIRTEIAKTLIKARSSKRVELSATASEDEVECIRNIAAVCDLEAHCGTNTISISCSDDAFPNLNRAIELLLEDVIKNPAQTAPQIPRKFPTNERSLILSELRASKQDELKTKAQRLWDLYSLRYRSSKSIRIRLYSMDNPQERLKEFSVSVLCTAKELLVEGRCGPGIAVYMRHTAGNLVEIGNSDRTLVELGMHPNCNLYVKSPLYKQ